MKLCKRCNELVEVSPEGWFYDHELPIRDVWPTCPGSGERVEEQNNELPRK